MADHPQSDPGQDSDAPPTVLPSRLERVLPGAILIVLAVFFLLSNRHLAMYEGPRMGAGYMPMVVSVLMLVIGIVVLIQENRGPAVAGEAMAPIPWRGLVLIGGGLLVFALAIRVLGMAASSFLLVAMAGFAAKDSRPLGALLGAVALTVFVLVIFSWLLGLYIPVLPTFLGH